MYLKIIIISLIVNIPIFGKCAQKRIFTVNIDELQTWLNKETKNPKDSKQKSLLLNLLKTSTPKLEYRLYNQHKNDKYSYIVKLSINEFRNILKKEISKSSDWKLAKNNPINKRLLKSRDNYITSIGDDSYLLAWYYTSVHEIDKALPHLNKLFTDEYKKSLKMESTRNSLCGSTPQLYWLKKYYQSVLVLESKERAKEVKKMYREVELHISTVPRFHRVT